MVPQASFYLVCGGLNLSLEHLAVRYGMSRADRKHRCHCRALTSGVRLTLNQIHYARIGGTITSSPAVARSRGRQKGRLLPTSRGESLNVPSPHITQHVRRTYHPRCTEIQAFRSATQPLDILNSLPRRYLRHQVGSFLRAREALWLFAISGSRRWKVFVLERHNFLRQITHMMTYDSISVKQLLSRGRDILASEEANGRGS